MEIPKWPGSFYAFSISPKIDLDHVRLGQRICCDLGPWQEPNAKGGKQIWCRMMGLFAARENPSNSLTSKRIVSAIVESGTWADGFREKEGQARGGGGGARKSSWHKTSTSKPSSNYLTAEWGRSEMYVGAVACILWNLVSETLFLQERLILMTAWWSKAKSKSE